MTLHHHFLRLAMLALSILAAAPSAMSQQIARFPVTALTAGMHVIQAEVAANDAQRQQGLMFREKMAQNEGMVFLFPRAEPICMWMKNTLLPLSVAFLDDDGTVVNIEDMKPQTLDSHCAKRPVRYALEMNIGWFKQKGFKPGSKIEGLPTLR